MAKIIDGDFAIEIKPVVNVNSWIEYTFNFLCEDKPIFNPEVIRNIPIRGDEIMRESLVSLFEKATQCKKNSEVFRWGSDEPDIELVIDARLINWEGKLDCVFDIEVFFNEVYFKSREGNDSFGSNPAGIRLFQDRNDLTKFSKEFRAEYEKSLLKARKANPDIRL